jgi:hypothetical protein
MPRRLIFVALTLSMLMQAMMLGNSFAAVGSKHPALHALMHWAGLAHHHHHHSGYHQDQSPDSTQHVLMDGCLSGPAMIPSWPDALPGILDRCAAPIAAAQRMTAEPYLQGPRRPPRRSV